MLSAFIKSNRQIFRTTAKVRDNAVLPFYDIMVLSINTYRFCNTRAENRLLVTFTGTTSPQVVKVQYHFSLTVANYTGDYFCKLILIER